jgi:hypothetical protein
MVEKWKAASPADRENAEQSRANHDSFSEPSSQAIPHADLYDANWPGEFQSRLDEQ